jgi:STE24 endopeptidase
VSDEIAVSLLFLGTIALASDIINLPFSLYDTFVIERKYGFNTMSVRIFITDHLKSWFIAILVGGPVLAILAWLFYLLGSGFWLYAWAVITLFTVLINFFYSELIVPLFNKQVPLGEGSLREKIETFANNTGFRLKDIYVIDGSKRSTRANAYFSGFGPKKRIVLYDTLMKDLSEEEIVAVLAHETGHYRKKHVILSLVSSFVTTGLMLYLFSLAAGNPYLPGALGSDKPSFHLAIIVFGILYSPVSLMLGLVSNYISRRNEYEADKFARENFGAFHLAEALKKLSVKNLSNMMPHPAYVFFHYSHPPLLSRLEKLE